MTMSRNTLRVPSKSIHLFFSQKNMCFKSNNNVYSLKYDFFKPYIKNKEVNVRKFE